MTTSQNQSVSQGLLPIDGRLILSSKDESVEGVAFVSGIQGVICTTFLVEEFHLLTGKSRLKPVCGSAAIATPTDSFIGRVTTPNWRVS